MIKEEVPPEGNPNLDQESLHIKEEQEKTWISHEGEQVNGLNEGFPFTAVPVKAEVKEEKPKFLQLHQSRTEDQGETEPPASSLATQIKTETHGEECGGSEPVRELEPDHPPINTSEQTSGCKGKEKTESQMRVNKGESFGCDFCWKRFTSKATLKEHIRAHTGETEEKTFSCDVCWKTFSKRAKLNTHLKIHSGVSPFGCDVCGKTFKCKTYFEVHMRVHTGERPFGCDVCGKRFRAKAKLKRHSGVHSGEKPHSCDVCGKRFREKTQVKAHMRVHGGEKHVQGKSSVLPCC